MKFKLAALTIAIITFVLVMTIEKSYSNEINLQDTVKYCPVSGEKIDGSEGKPVTFNYLGKEYTFCCENCVAAFKKDPKKYIKEELLCPVMGEAVDEENTTVYNGVKYYFCCKPCIKKFNNNPEKYLNGYKQ